MRTDAVAAARDVVEDLSAELVLAVDLDTVEDLEVEVLVPRGLVDVVIDRLDVAVEREALAAVVETALAVERTELVVERLVELLDEETAVVLATDEVPPSAGTDAEANRTPELLPAAANVFVLDAVEDEGRRLTGLLRVKPYEATTEPPDCVVPAE